MIKMKNMKINILRKITLINTSILLLVALYACNPKEQAETKKSLTLKDYHDTFAGIGFLTLKEEALADDKTQFEFFEDRELTTPFATFDFGTGKTSQEEITPEFFRPEDKVCYFRCIGWDSERYYVYTNTLAEALKYVPVDTNKYRFIKWEDFIVNIPKITRLQPEDNPVKIRPNFKAANADWDSPTSNVFMMKEVYKKWAKVTDLSGNNEGWILWTDKDRILVKFDKNSIKPLNQLKTKDDPSANPLNFLRPKVKEEK